MPPKGRLSLCRHTATRTALDVPWMNLTLCRQANLQCHDAHASGLLAWLVKINANNKKKQQQENPTTRCSQTNTQTSRQHASTQLTPQPPPNTQCKTRQENRNTVLTATYHHPHSSVGVGRSGEGGLRRHTNPGLLRQGPPPAAAKFQAWLSSAHASHTLHPNATKPPPKHHGNMQQPN